MELVAAEQRPRGAPAQTLYAPDSEGNAPQRPGQPLPGDGKKIDPTEVPLTGINLGLRPGQVPDYENEMRPKHLPGAEEADAPYWQSHGYHAAVGVDSTAALMQQHQDIYKRSLKERALKQRTRKVFRDEDGAPGEEHVYRDEEAQRLNQDTLFRHHPTIPSLLKPMYEPVRPEILNPQNVLAAGSRITIGITEEQKDRDQRAELEQRRVAALEFRVDSLNQQQEEGLGGLVTGLKPVAANDRMRVFQKTDLFVEKYE